MGNSLMKLKGINIKMVEMVTQLKKRQKELSDNYLVVRNQIIDLETELQKNKKQLQKITGAIVELNSLIQLCEAEKEQK